MKKRALAVTAMLAAVTLLAACGSTEQAAEPATVQAPQSVTVNYMVVMDPLIGAGRMNADMTLRTPTGVQQKSADYPLPSGLTSEAGLNMEFAEGDAVYLSAQNSGSGLVICAIYSDGVLISKNYSNAKYGIATCEGVAELDPAPYVDPEP